MQRALQPQDIVIRSYKNGKVLSEQSIVEQAEELYRAPFLTTHRADVHGILLEFAEKQGVTVQLDCHVSGMNFDKQTLRLSSDELHEADMVIGADGDLSMCRETMFVNSYQLEFTGDQIYRMAIKQSDMLGNLVSPIY